MVTGLPEKLQTLRIKYGYSQKLVADKIGVSPSVISGYETGERTPSLEVLLSLALVYNCSTDYLLGRQATLPKICVDVSGLSDVQIQAINNLVESIRAK